MKLLFIGLAAVAAIVAAPAAPISTLGEPAIAVAQSKTSALVTQLSASDPTQRASAACQLGEMGPDAASAVGVIARLLGTAPKSKTSIAAITFAATTTAAGKRTADRRPGCCGRARAHRRSVLRHLSRRAARSRCVCSSERGILARALRRRPIRGSSRRGPRRCRGDCAGSRHVVARSARERPRGRAARRHAA